MTLDYLRFTGRDASQVALVEAYARAQGLFRTEATPDAVYSETIELDLATVEPSLAGPRRPQDRVALGDVKTSFATALPGLRKGVKTASTASGGGAAVAEAVSTGLEDGSVVIAAITSCTNTSNPNVMIAAGLVAKRAVERGLTPIVGVETRARGAGDPSQGQEHRAAPPQGADEPILKADGRHARRRLVSRSQTHNAQHRNSAAIPSPALRGPFGASFLRRARRRGACPQQGRLAPRPRRHSTLAAQGAEIMSRRPLRPRLREARVVTAAPLATARAHCRLSARGSVGLDDRFRQADSAAAG
jgi:hypothetical protein